MTSVYFLMIRELRTTKVHHHRHHHHHHHHLMITAVFFEDPSVQKKHSNPKSPENRLDLDPSGSLQPLGPTESADPPYRWSAPPGRREAHHEGTERTCGALLNRNEKKGGEAAGSVAKVAMHAETKGDCNTWAMKIWKLERVWAMSNPTMDLTRFEG